jgi:O-antigen ligase
MLRISIRGSLALLMALTAGLVISGLEIRAGLRLRISDVFLLLSMPLIIALFIRGTSTNRLIWICLAYAFYASYTALNAYYLTSKGTAIKEGMQFLVFFMAFLGFVYGTEQDAHFRKFVRIWFVLLCGVALYSAGYHIIVLNTWSGWKELGDQKLAYGLLMVLVLGLRHDRFLSGKTFAVVALLVLAMLFLSGERKGWIAALAGCMTILFMAPHGRMSRTSLNSLLYFLLFCLVLLVVLSVVAPFFPYLDRQLSSINGFVEGIFGVQTEQVSSSNEDRLFILSFGLQLFQQHPFFGAGLDTFVRHMAQLPGALTINGAHNEPLRIAAELGLVGLGLYLGLYLLAGLRIMQIRALGRDIGEIQFVKFRLAAGLLVYGFVVNVFLAGGGVSFFLVVLPLGLLYSVPLRATARAGTPVPMRHGWQSRPAPGAGRRLA